MAIDVTHEPDDWGVALEHCAFCWKTTHYWFTAKDVAVCRACAEQVNAEDVPTKLAWFGQTAGLGKVWNKGGDEDAG